MRKKSEQRFDENRNFEDKCSIHRMDTTTAINELTEQIKAVVEQVQRMAVRSEEHDRTLAFLQQNPENIFAEKTAEVAQQMTFDAFRIPDPIKSIPEYDGNRKQLNAWLQTAEDTLRVFVPLVSEPQIKLYVQAVSNKIKGRAKDALCLAGNPQSFQEIKTVLLETLGDKQELSFYKSQLWATKQNENMTVHSYFNKIKENVQNIKTLARQNTTYNHAWSAINTFIEEDALAAFISGLRKPYFGYAQAAKPKNIEEAYAFLCKFTTNELISNNIKKPNQSSIQNKFNNFQPRHNTNSVINRKPPQPEIGKPTPMSIDVSTRSKNTFNRAINTHEILAEPENSQTDEDEIVEDLSPEFEVYSTNFQEDLPEDTAD